VRSFIKGKTRKQLDTNLLLASGIVHQLSLLGEAANAISQKTKNTYPDVPWKKIVAMRNRLIHEYFDIDYEILWNTSKEFLPSLISQLTIILRDLTD
jgi:uncharacterized protein with HEPN domain